MKRSTWISATLLSVAGLVCAVTALGKSMPYDFQLTQTLAGCDDSVKLATFYADITWNPMPGSRTFKIGTGNHCELSGKVCGLSSSVCTFTCPGTGPCKARLEHCQISRGSYRLSIVEVASAKYQHPPVTTKPPSDLCRTTK